MPDLDLFGLNEDPKADDPTGSAGSEEPKPADTSARRSPWKALAAADVLLILACAAFLAQRLHARWELLSARPVAPGGPMSPLAQAPKPAAPPAAAPAAKAAPKPEPPAEAPVRTAKDTPPAPSDRGPIGSPSVHAPHLPDRSASARSAPGEAPAAPNAAPQPAAEEPAEPMRTTRPVTFTHTAPDAKEVYLLGPFLVRTEGRKAMTRNSRGDWRATVYLNIGYSYRYRFEVVDSQGRRALTPNRSMDIF